ncbi:polyprenyl synthetase family protein [Actinomyces sp. ZJ308]|uniref:polyprenyl synthetase family protein n=1 Tax=Actinomyces sp. ZJ308 TaxID=2708342 RepID=UPI001423E6D8|nr:polyprenyl synthetase family protein [Actinomyces sp. ZJ308]
MSALPAALGRVRPAVEHRLEEVLSGCHRRWEDLGQAAPELLEAAASVLTGGKRMRAVLGAVGYALTIAPEHRSERLTSDDAVRLGAALELYQASALVHDDLMDGADTRRGLPAAHRAFSRDHGARGWLGCSQAFGANGAILLGDLLLSLAGEEMSALAQARAASEAGQQALRHARSAFDAMTTEVALGQFLDVRSENLPLPWGQDPVSAARRMHDDALSVVRHKSARYSVRHPLLIGALLAGVEPAGPTAEHLAVFGEEIGIAFQLRDDELGVFGSPQVTGKPAGDDLREGKRTVLLALTWSRCDDVGRELLGSVLANAGATAEQITEAATLIEDCGARDAHEEIIITHRDAGLEALERLRDEGVVSTASLKDLAALADLLTHRSS